VCIEPAYLCEQQQNLILAPLPARKQLWDACDEQQWALELYRHGSEKDKFGLARSGELVKLGEDQQGDGCHWIELHPQGVGAESATKVDWEEWCAGMDSLGTLVMLAASLSSPV